MELLGVECRAGSRADEDVRAFRLGGREVRVARTLDRWLAPDHRYFKLESEEGDVYLLRHDVASDAWELVQFRGGAGQET